MWNYFIIKEPFPHFFCSTVFSLSPSPLLASPSLEEKKTNATPSLRLNYFILILALKVQILSQNGLIWAPTQQGRHISSHGRQISSWTNCQENEIIAWISFSCLNQVHNPIWFVVWLAQSPLKNMRMDRTLTLILTLGIYMWTSKALLSKSSSRAKGFILSHEICK